MRPATATGVLLTLSLIGGAAMSVATPAAAPGLSEPAATVLSRSTSEPSALPGYTPAGVAASKVAAPTGSAAASMLPTELAAGTTSAAANPAGTTAAGTPTGSATSSPSPTGSPTSASPSPTGSATTPAPSATSEPTESAPPKDPKPKPSAPNCAKLKCVALTMDDGPIPQTAKVLKVLRQEGAHATFFVLGQNAKAYPKVIRRMAADGNAIGNHSWNHPQFWHVSKATIRSQLARTDKVVKKITGKRTQVIRVPYGEFDRRVRSVAKSRGQALIQWSVDPLDWRDRNAKVVTKRILKRTKRNSIILTHDIHPSSRKAYPAIIRGLKAKGYTLVTVPELLKHKAKPGVVYFHG